MRVLKQTLDKLILENKAPKYRSFLGYFLASFPLLLLAYVIHAQRNYLDCTRSNTNKVDCQYIQEYNFPISSRERFSLTDIQATRVYQEVFISAEGEKSVQNSVLVLGRDNHLYIDNFRDIEAATDFKQQLEGFARGIQEGYTTISRSSLDTFWMLLRQRDNYHYYLWGMLCLVAGGILVYDAVYQEIYLFNDRTKTLSHQQRRFIFEKETDYLLERIIDVRIEPSQDHIRANFHRIILTLSNGEEIILNSRLLEPISNGVREQKILAEISKRLNLSREEILV